MIKRILGIMLAFALAIHTATTVIFASDNLEAEAENIGGEILSEDNAEAESGDMFEDFFSGLFSSDFLSDFSLSDFSIGSFPEYGEPFDEESPAYTRDLLYDKSANKQFITVQTRGGNTFYVIIDYDKPLDGDGEQYATYFLNPVDERDLFDLLGDEEIPPETCKCTDKCEVGAINISCSVCKSDYEKCIGIEHKAVAPVEEGNNPTDNETLKDEPTEQKSNSTVLIIALVAAAAIAGGVYYYIRVVKGKRSKDSDTEFFDDDGYEDEYINEDNDNEDDVEADESEI